MVPAPDARSGMFRRRCQRQRHCLRDRPQTLAVKSCIVPVSFPSACSLPFVTAKLVIAAVPLKAPIHRLRVRERPDDWHSRKWVLQPGWCQTEDAEQLIEQVTQQAIVAERAPAMAQRRLPRRLPGPDCAVISRTTWLRCTVRPNRFRSSGASTRCKIWHVPVGAASGIDTCRLTLPNILPRRINEGALQRAEEPPMSRCLRQSR